MGMSKKAPTLRQFLDQFPTEDSCLDHLMRVRYGDRHDCAKCGRNAHFYRVKARKVYSCEYCGAQVAPMAGTPFERTRTSLRDWFHVMFMFTTTRNGVAAKEVERQLGVTYKTAWRMCHEIRKYMAAVDGDEPIGGAGQVVEIDETFIGGEEAGAQGGKGKAIVMGMLERGGDISTHVVDSRKAHDLIGPILANVSEGSEIHTDALRSYAEVRMWGFAHKTVNHRKGEYVAAGNVSVNAIEGFWAQLKRGINGTHIHVSAKHLPKYLGEFEYRHNRRDRPETMLAELLLSFSR
jgi:ribosomal protein L37AE/L43A